MHAARINTAYLVNLLQTSIDTKAYIAGKLVHAHILRLGLSTDAFLLNRLIELYSKCGHIQAARHLFDQMLQPNIYSWHSLLSAYCKERQLHNAYKLFLNMPERNTVSWNTVISAFARNGLETKALEVYSQMNAHGFSPTHITLASVLSACGGLGELECGRLSHASALKYGLHKNVYVGNALLSLYVKCGCPHDALIAFRELDEPNEVSFTAMMCGLVETDQVEEVFEMFRLIQRSGIRIDSVSLSTVLRVCAKGGSSNFGETDDELPNTQGKQVHGLTIKLGFERDLHVCNSLLDMYAKNGGMESAVVLFGNLSETSTVSWNVMISGFGQNRDK